MIQRLAEESMRFSRFLVWCSSLSQSCLLYNFKNATGKKRFSEYDIMDSSEEPDPLNERFGEHTPVHHESVPEADAFCPYCGTPVEDDYRFCNSCGKKLPQKHTFSE